MFYGPACLVPWRIHNPRAGFPTHRDCSSAMRSVDNLESKAKKATTTLPQKRSLWSWDTVSFDFYGNFAPRGHLFSWYKNAPTISAGILSIFSNLVEKLWFLFNSLKRQIGGFHIHLIFNLRIYNDTLSFRFNCPFFLLLFYDIACGEEADFSLPTSHLLNLKYQILYRVVSTYVIFW